jgi:hypothetical protein
LNQKLSFPAATSSTICITTLSFSLLNYHNLLVLQFSNSTNSNTNCSVDHHSDIQADTVYIIYKIAEKNSLFKGNCYEINPTRMSAVVKPLEFSISIRQSPPLGFIMT